MKFILTSILLGTLLFLATGTVSQAGPITFAVNTSSSGTFTASALDNSGGGAFDNITVNSGVTVASTGGDIVFSTGDDIFLSSGSTLSAAGSIILNLGVGAEPVDGSTATLAGQLNAVGVTVNGGPNSDTLNYLGPAALLTFTSADHLSGTITATGSPVISFNSIENVTGNLTAPPNPTPEPTSIVLFGSGLIGLILRRRARSQATPR